MGVVWIEKDRNGDKTITRVDDAGKRTTLFKTPRKTVTPGVRSLSNGVVGGPGVLAKTKALDRKLGVADKIEYVPLGNGSYAADYGSVGDYDKWMHAHKRVNSDAGCGTPCPGDFRGQFPQEEF